MKSAIRSLITGVLLSVILLPAFAWACGALWYDAPSRWLGMALVAVMVVALVMIHGLPRKLLVFALWFLAVLAWWLTLKPSHEGDWRPEMAELAWADIQGDTVTLHNVRNTEYRSATDSTPRWETRTVQLSRLTGIDIAINYWGSPWMAHPLVSFQFDNAPAVCFSIETRQRRGQGYSAIGGLYRQFTLIYIVGDEGDLIRGRTNFKESEDLYLYRTTATPERARERFLEYLAATNSLRDHPRWYNAVTTNCTTTIRAQHPASTRAPWDWRILVNGKGDELMYERGAMATGGLPFAELKQKAYINPVARESGSAPDFSAAIRAGRPGFE